jgi:hypothetical protein
MPERIATMFESSFPVMAVWVNAGVFALAGLVNLTAFGAVREVYARWDIPAVFYRTLGIVQIIAAALLAMPDFRAWGIAMAAPVMFGAIVLLLDHRLYRYAAPAILVLAALVPGMLATPQHHSPIHYASALLPPESSSVAIAAGPADAVFIADVRDSQHH